jgi:hypothetical protein
MYMRDAGQGSEIAIVYVEVKSARFPHELDPILGMRCSVLH